MAVCPKKADLGRPLKIALFSDSALPILNGVSVSIDALIGELRERGHSVHLYTSRYPGHKEQDPNIHRFFGFKTIFAKDYPLSIPPFYYHLPEFRRIGFDVVHTHTPFTVGFIGLRWAQSHELPIVSTYHTHYDKYVHYLAWAPKRLLRFKVAKHTNYYYNLVDCVITPSEASERWLRRHSVKTPCEVIPTGVPNPRMIDRFEARAALGISPQTKLMLYVGRLAVEKNLSLLLEMAAEVFPHDPHLRLWLVGDGPAREELLARARAMGIGDRVKFVGFVPRREVDQYYAAADLFTFTSMTETQGLVVAEAMTYGLPAIVVKGGGAGAAVEDGLNGYLIRNDPTEMAELVLQILEDDVLAATLAEGARRTSRQYTIAGMTDRVEEVYRRVIAAREVSHPLVV
jgi:glycosyltransferase involved in cell wall biosynthesis